MKKFLLLLTSAALVQLTACSNISRKAANSLRNSNMNDAVYIPPTKKIIVPKSIKFDSLPVPVGSDNKAEVDFEMRKAAELTEPPIKYQIPTKTSTKNKLGEDEEIKQMRKEKNPNVTPSKKSILG